MWNLRNALRNLGYRVKSSANANSAGVQTTKEGRTEFEEEYKHFWAANFRANDLPFRAVYEARGRSLLHAAARPSGWDGSGKRNESQRERADWDATKTTPSRTWLEALGWGALLGFGMNLLHPKQEELWRKKCPVDSLTESGIPSKWLTTFCALSMPLDQSALIKSVLPSGGSYRRRFSISESATSSTSETEESTTSIASDIPEYERPAYSSEASVLLKTTRDRLATLARDYIAELEELLGLSNMDVPADDSHFAAQEQYNLGLFYELGIGVTKSRDQAMKHYVEAALLDHPVAIQNLIALHKHTLPSGSNMHRSSSSPVLSVVSSGTFFPDQKPKPVTQTKEKPSGKFWSDESSDSGASFSRSTSFPDLPSLVTCK